MSTLPNDRVKTRLLATRDSKPALEGKPISKESIEPKKETPKNTETDIYDYSDDPNLADENW